MNKDAPSNRETKARNIAQARSSICKHQKQKARQKQEITQSDKFNAP